MIRAKTGKKDFVVLLNDVELFEDKEKPFALVKPLDLLEKSIESLYKVYLKKTQKEGKLRSARRMKLYFGKKSTFNPSEKTTDKIVELLKQGILSMNWRCLESSSKAYFRVVRCYLIESSPNKFLQYANSLIRR